ncbi:MAG: archaeal proteasome endopeptidase complex subunit alpha [Thermoproteota archaeon]|nr:archaeal proteasome endopeptidase complex subunit alpha [Thermoproteota archaeon]
MMPSQQGYDRAITVFSPDGRLYQVEYAIETVRRGAIAVGIRTNDGIIIAVEEKSRKLQIINTPQKIFQIDYHIGAAAAGYIPDARSQIDNARTFSQSNKLVYDEPVEVETVAKHLADQCQQYTQYGGARPIGVSLIIGGIDPAGTNLYMTDPSGSYISYDAISIGANADTVNEFLEKNYKKDMSLDDAASLAVAAIYISSETKEGVDHIKMSRVSGENANFEFMTNEEISKFAVDAKTKYPADGK